MKNLLLLAFSLLLLTASCKKDNNVNNPAGIPEGTIVAKIDGKDYKSTFSECQINQVFGELFSIAGTTEAGDEKFETLLLMLNFPIGEGVAESQYNSSGSDCDPSSEMCGSMAYGIHRANTDLSHSSLIDGGISEIKFTSIDYRSGGHAIGTFSGKLVNGDGQSISITDGKFNVAIK